MVSPTPTTACQGLVRQHGSQLLEFGPPGASQNHENGTETDASSATNHDKSVLGKIIVPTLGAAGSQKAPRTKKYVKYRKVRNGQSTGTLI